MNNSVVCSKQVDRAETVVDYPLCRDQGIRPRAAEGTGRTTTWSSSCSNAAAALHQHRCRGYPQAPEHGTVAPLQLRAITDAKDNRRPQTRKV
jgi:hypothetical protein